MSKLLNITNIDDYVKTLVSNKFVVADFYTTWCGPCKILGPYFHDLSEKYADKIQFCKVNCDDHYEETEEIHTRCDIDSFPTILFYKDAHRWSIMKGCSPEALEAKINELINTK
jgi:thioredoxin